MSWPVATVKWNLEKLLWGDMDGGQLSVGRRYSLGQLEHLNSFHELPLLQYQEESVVTLERTFLYSIRVWVRGFHDLLDQKPPFLLMSWLTIIVLFPL